MFLFLNEAACLLSDTCNRILSLLLHSINLKVTLKLSTIALLGDSTNPLRIFQSIRQWLIVTTSIIDFSRCAMCYWCHTLFFYGSVKLLGSSTTLCSSSFKTLVRLRVSTWRSLSIVFGVLYQWALSVTCLAYSDIRGDLLVILLFVMILLFFLPPMFVVVNWSCLFFTWIFFLMLMGVYWFEPFTYFLLFVMVTSQTKPGLVDLWLLFNSLFVLYGLVERVNGWRFGFWLQVLFCS